MNHTFPGHIGLHSSRRSWILIPSLASIALLLVLILWMGLVEREGAVREGVRAPTTWAEALRQAKTAFSERRIVGARNALAHAYRLAMIEPGWEGLVVLGDLMQELDWDRQIGYYGGLSFTARGAYLQAFHLAHATGDWQGMFLTADRLEALGDRAIPQRLRAIAWRRLGNDPKALARMAVLRMPEEEWP